MKSLPILTLIGSLIFSLAGCTAADPEQNRQAGQAFLAENAKQPGVQVTASGLQYQVLREGTGIKPSATDVVTVDYRGTLPNGKEFDSGKGISFPLNGVIPGWTEGLQLMAEGAQYRFAIPAELAYGEHGAARVIGPNMALVFDVTLLKVQR